MTDKKNRFKNSILKEISKLKSGITSSSTASNQHDGVKKVRGYNKAFAVNNYEKSISNGNIFKITDSITKPNKHS